jgi:acyl-coenzyme A thioesterase PaaI-like protein
MEEPDHAHFKSIPWCSQLLQDPDFAVTPTFSRQPKKSTEDSLIAETFQTDDTIKACLSIYRTPAPGTNWISEVRTFMTLGTGMNGGVLLLHGGIIATLMDDVIGTLLTVNKDSNAIPLTHKTVTASMNTSYVRPVPTPGTILVVARCREVKGRKFYMEADVRDGDGVVLAKADSLWIGPKLEKL